MTEKRIEEEMIKLTMDCSGCGGICCHSHNINLMQPEAKRLRVIKPNLKLKDFGKFFYMEKPCPFFKDNKCSIYEIRPSICRSYPISIAEMKQDVLVWYKRTDCPEADNLKGQELNAHIFEAFQGTYFASILVENLSPKNKKKMAIYQQIQLDQEPIKQTKGMILTQKTILAMVQHIHNKSKDYFELLAKYRKRKNRVYNKKER